MSWCCCNLPYRTEHLGPVHTFFFHCTFFFLFWSSFIQVERNQAILIGNFSITQQSLVFKVRDNFLHNMGHRTSRRKSCSERAGYPFHIS